MQARVSTKLSELRARGEREREPGEGAVTPLTCDILLELRTATGRWAGRPNGTPVHGVALVLVDFPNIDLLDRFSNCNLQELHCK